MASSNCLAYSPTSSSCNGDALRVPYFAGAVCNGPPCACTMRGAGDKRGPVERSNCNKWAGRLKASQGAPELGKVHRAANLTARTCAAQRRGAGQKIPRSWRWNTEAKMGARPCQSLRQATRQRLSATQAEQGHILWSRAAPAMSPPKTSQLPSKPPGRSQAHAVCQSVVVGRCVSCADHKGDSVRARSRAWQAASPLGVVAG